MPKEWTVVRDQITAGRGADGPMYSVSARKVGIFGSGKPVDAGRFATRDEADTYVAQHRGVDDSVTHIEQ